MAILPLEDFWQSLEPDRRLMALDVGAKTIGLATVLWGRDEVMPLKTLHRIKFTLDAHELTKLIKAYEVQALVIGWPLLPDGRQGKRCQSVRDFTAELDRFLILAGFNIPIIFWDERFSTAHGDEMVDHIGKTAGKAVGSSRRDQMIDALAAQKILQDFIERA